MISKGQNAEVRKRRHRLIQDPVEMAKQYYLLAKTTMANRNVSSIYTLDLHAMDDDEFSDFFQRYRDEMNYLVDDTRFKAVILNSQDLSDQEKDELTRLTDIEQNPKNTESSENKIYFQLQKKT